MLKPEFLKMIASLDDGRFASLAETLTETAPEVSVRLNPRKFSPAGETPFPEEPVPWCEGGIYLSERPKFTFDPALHQGVYYVQDASSMIMGAVAAELARRLAGGPLLWLDACAAPGGKTTAALDALPSGSLVVANEFDYGRAEILAENVAKWGSPYTVVTRGDTARCRAVGEVFDVVAVDAPCSGEGMMRREQMAIDQWSEKLIAQCAATQREILPYAVGALREGGYLIYSTCTYNPRENEDNVRWLTENFPLEQVATPFEGLYGIHSALDSGMHALRFFPHLTPGEGLFVALMRKTGEERGGKRRRPAKIKAVKVPEWIKGNVPLKAFERIAGKDRRINVIPEQWADDIIRISSALNCIYTGTEAAENKGRDMIPTHDSFLASSFVRGIYPELQLSEEAAIDYLRCNNPLPQPDIPRGLCAAVCEGAVIGRANNLGTRINNLYPKEYRIRNL